jgi:hypothetical protein
MARRCLFMNSPPKTSNTYAGAIFSADGCWCLFARHDFTSLKTQRIVAVEYGDAIGNPDFQTAIQKEVHSFLENKCVTAVPEHMLHRTDNLISTRWVFTIKYSLAGAAKYMLSGSDRYMFEACRVFLRRSVAAGGFYIEVVGDKGNDIQRDGSEIIKTRNECRLDGDTD